MAGRRVGEPGNFKGTEYIAREFRRLGLRPGGDSGTFFQTLPWGFTGFDSATSQLSVGGRALVARRDWVPMPPAGALAIGGGAALTSVETVFAGRIGDTATMLDPAAFRGRVAVFLPPQEVAPPAGGGGGGGGRGLPSCADVPNRFGAAAAVIADSIAAAGRGAGGGAGRGGAGGRGGRGGQGGGQMRDVRALNAGAVGVFLVALDAMAPQARATVFNGRGGMRPANSSVAQGLAGATISDAVAAQLFGRPLDQVAVGTIGQPVSAAWSFEWRPTRHPARNVIAVLPGSDPARAGEYVLVSAHNDHVGTNATGVDHDSLRAVNWVTRRQGANDPVCVPTPEQQRVIDSLLTRARSIRPPRRDSIMNGADDDGSGTVVMLEIAERFAAERPARSIIFMSHQGEEAGLLGSRWFVDHPTLPLASIVAAHNMDMVGKGRTEYVKFGGPNSIQALGARRLSREFGDIIDSVNAIRSEPMAIDRSWDVTANPMRRFCRSDQVNYVRKDIPVTYFSTGYSPDYHQATDDPQYVEYDHAARIARFIHDVMLAIANRRDKPAIAGPDLSYPQC
jgi:Zn-dependent M28 family amino/carboxypeptidase